MIHETPVHEQQATVWCVMWPRGVIGPYFFEKEARYALTVNGVRCRNITEFLWPQLNGMDMEDMWFQQDGATSHTARETIALLQEKFPSHVISRNGDQNWPPWSCDLTACDFCLWGFLKSRVYVNNPEAIYALKEEIRCHWRNQSTNMRKWHRKFPEESKSMPAKSWRTFVRHFVPRLVVMCVLSPDVQLLPLFK